MAAHCFDGNGTAGLQHRWGDGDVDEGSFYDDDEDDDLDDTGIVAEIYYFDNGTNQLRYEVPYLGSSKILSDRVTAFQVTYEAPERILIELTLTGDDGETVQFSEYVYPRNTYQKTGKRVK